MDYEKLYKDALERAKKLKETCDSTAVVGWCEYIFPELKESEDEKIRKVLIDYFKGYKEHEECGIRTFYGIPTNDFLTWLEKQGEQKPINDTDEEIVNAVKDTSVLDLVEPKFKVGD